MLFEVSPSRPEAIAHFGNDAYPETGQIVGICDPLHVMGLPLHNIHRNAIIQRVIDGAVQQRKMMVVNANAQLVVLAQTMPWISARRRAASPHVSGRSSA
ncbi:MAG: hypothetical protein POH28_06455 [Acidocella sp.]|nr:hypothetical protein [Acidocella sp.]